MRPNRCETGDAFALSISRFGSWRVSSPAADSLTRCEPRANYNGARVSCYARRRLRGHPRLPFEISNCASLFREHCSLGGNDRRVESSRFLNRAELRRVIDVHEAEPLGVAVRPLVIVEQRPGIVSAKIDALLHRVMRCAQVLTQILGPQRIVDAAIDRVRRIVESC